LLKGERGKGKPSFFAKKKKGEELPTSQRGGEGKKKRKKDESPHKEKGALLEKGEKERGRLCGI